MWNVLQKCRLSAISLRLPLTKHSLLTLHQSMPGRARAAHAAWLPSTAAGGECHHARGRVHRLPRGRARARPSSPPPPSHHGYPGTHYSVMIGCLTAAVRRAGCSRSEAGLKKLTVRHSLSPCRLASVPSIFMSRASATAEGRLTRDHNVNSANFKPQVHLLRRTGVPAQAGTPAARILGCILGCDQARVCLENPHRVVLWWFTAEIQLHTKHQPCTC